jgi:RecG-like helicase
MSESISKIFITKMTHLGIKTLEDLLLYLPIRYVDYRIPEKSISSCIGRASKCYLKVKLTKKPIIKKIKNDREMVNMSFTDGQTHVFGSTFSGAHIWKNKVDGEFVHIMCNIGEYNGQTQLQNVEIVNESDVGRIVPIYKGKEKLLSPKLIGNNIAIYLREGWQNSVDLITKTIGSNEKTILLKSAPEFKSLKQLLNTIHRPNSFEGIEKATKAIRMINAYHALTLSQQGRLGDVNEKSIISYDINLIKKLLSNIPFILTNDQKQCIWDITKDLNSNIPMDRLISGDVGCGKTMSYGLPAACAHLSGSNVVIIMPNALLASQVANELKETFVGIDVHLMVSGANKNKNPIVGNPIIVGTTAILWWKKSLKTNYDIDLLIIDEQQKLGVEQKKALVSPHTNVIEATATAIPRTAAAVIYGNRKVSYIEQCPVEKEIISEMVGSDEKRRVFDELLQITKGGAQIAVLYPIRKNEISEYEIFINENVEVELINNLIDSISCAGGEILNKKAIKSDIEKDILENGTLINYKIKRTSNKIIISQLDTIENETDSTIILMEVPDNAEIEKCKRSVESATRHWEKHFPGQVVMIHGGLTIEQKIAAIKMAKEGSCKVIVTSSVIEIGLTMPDLRGLLVLEAEKYGASTLHQFRGRLARKGGKGKFFMGTDCPLAELEKSARDRLEILVRQTKGALIAEEDMRQRGFGDISMNTGKQAGYITGLFTGIKMTPQDVDILLTEISCQENKTFKIA